MSTMPHPWSFEIPQRGPCQIKSRHGLHVGTAITLDDATLMSAAPELLAAALKMRCHLCNWPIDEQKDADSSRCAMCQPLRNAIEKARGIDAD